MNNETQHPLLLVGCGKMGSAILSGLLPQIQSSACIKVVDPVDDGISLCIPHARTGGLAFVDGTYVCVSLFGMQRV